MAFVSVREKERKGYKLALARRAQQGHGDAESRMPNRSCPSFQFVRVLWSEGKCALVQDVLAFAAANIHL
jgi:hypothetical protein